MSETRTDYQASANGLPPREQPEAQPGTPELERIISARRDDIEPASEDVAVLRALEPDAVGVDLYERRGELIADLHGVDPQRQAAAWEAITGLLPVESEALWDGVERITDWHAVDAPDREWLIKDWMPAGRIGMFSGKGGKGKTWLLMQLATVMASGGGLWLNRAGANDPVIPEAAGGVVVFASWEDEGAEFKRRLQMMDAPQRKEYGDGYESLIVRIGDRFRFLDLSRRGPVWGVPEGGLFNARPALLPAGEIVRTECEQAGASLLILDSLGYAYGRNDNDNEGVADFMAAWDSWGRDHRCTVALVHHPPKDQTGSKGSAGYRGASSWEMHARWRWELGDEEMADGRLDRLTCEKASYAMRPNPVWIERNQRTGWAWREMGVQKPEPMPKKATRKSEETAVNGTRRRGKIKEEIDGNRIPGT